MSKIEFPRKICDKKGNPECSFAYRGIGMTCQTCNKYVHPGDPYAKELFQYYKEELAEEVPKPVEKENLTFHSILNAHSTYIKADEVLRGYRNRQNLLEHNRNSPTQEFLDELEEQERLVGQARQEMDRLQVLFEETLSCKMNQLLKDLEEAGE